MNIIIRKAIDSDFGRIVELANQVLEYHNKMMPDTFAPMNKEKQKELFLNWSKDENSYFLVAESDNNIVGYLYATFKKTPWYVATESCELNEIGVDNDIQSKGIGTKLFNALLSECLEKKIDEIRLNVWAANSSAIKLYERLGFKIKSYKMAKSLK